MHEKTRLIHAGRTPDRLARTVGPPIQRGSTVLMPDSRALYEDDLGYGRSGLAAQSALSDALCTLEGAESVQLYPSGLAALTGALLAVLKAGDSILISEGAYKPTRQFCQNVLQRLGVRIQLHDARLSADEVLALVADDTRLILLESPSSLTFEMQDVPAIAAGARARGVLTLIDNTWAAGLYFKPLAHGVDISVQALTKYVCGHSDIFMGSAAAADPAIGALLEAGVHDLGWAVTGEAAYDMLRGLRTLPTRLARHDQSARAIAAWLAEQPQVLKVLHPALPGDPGHAIWARDYSGASGLFGVVMQPGSLAAQHAFLDALKLFGLGFSWGGFESLAIRCDPQLTSRPFVKALEGPLMRLHIGLEDETDLIEDLKAALAAYESVSG